jgi:hypothetical protein
MPDVHRDDGFLILDRLPTASRQVDYSFKMDPYRSTIIMDRDVPPEKRATGAPPGLRKPRRITITIPDIIYSQLLECSNSQGRSISNLAAYLLERSMQESLDDGQNGSNHDLDSRQSA